MRRESGFAAAAAMLLLIGIAVFWIDIFCFSFSFYQKEYEKLGTAKSIGMTEQSLTMATQALLDYLRDNRDDLSVTAEIQGEVREVFNAREKQHMVDVKQLYLTARAVGYGCLALGAGCLLLLFWKAGKSKYGKEEILQGYLKGNGIFFAILAVIGLFAAIDFDTFWTLFHKVLFTNDLWLLNPRTDILIMIVPEEFFFDLVMRIAEAAVSSIGLLLLGAWFWKKKLEKETDGKGYAEAGETQ